ncbi:MAG: ABC transporter permease [Micrococcaceae bacterium]
MSNDKGMNAKGRITKEFGSLKTRFANRNKDNGKTKTQKSSKESFKEYLEKAEKSEQPKNTTKKSNDEKSVHPKAPWPKTFGIAIAAAAVVSIIALAFLWPAKAATPHNIPIAVTGNNAQQVQTIKENIQKNGGDKIDLVSVKDRNEAVQKMKDRDVYGALIMNMPNPEVLTASANGNALNAIPTQLAETLQTTMAEQQTAQVTKGMQQMMQAVQAGPQGAQAMQQMAGQLQNAPKVELKVTDVIPAHKSTFDIAALAMPMVFGGMIGGMFIASAVAGKTQRFAALLFYALLAGTFVYLILGVWFDVIPHHFWEISGALSLGIFATSSFIVATYVLFGPKGLGISVPITMLVANPMSGLAVPQLFLPTFWGNLGQHLTVGAGGSLVRAAAYFHDPGVYMQPLITLIIWSVVCGGLVFTRHRKHMRA